jgi:hypothetical protein
MQKRKLTLVNPDDPQPKPVLPPRVDYEDFYAHSQEHKFIFRPNGTLWPKETINQRLPPRGRIKPSDWLFQQSPVDQSTWAPGEDELICDKGIKDGGWYDRPGGRIYNSYKPPRFGPGRPDRAERWVKHVHMLYGDDADHIVKWCACRVQAPYIKINHAMVLGGDQGIGKDTLLAPVCYAIGEWNVQVVSPQQVMGRFNPFLKCVLLIVSEAHDLGEFNRPALYERMKQIICTPPETIRIDEKHRQEHYILNRCGVVYTTNHKATGIYLPADDRRHFVAWSTLGKSSFSDDYWTGIWHWYEYGGYDDVAAYLMDVDLTDFDPKAPPPQTAAFHEIVTAATPPEVAELLDALDRLRNPDAVTVAEIVTAADGSLGAQLLDRRNSRLMASWFEMAGYVSVKNPNGGHNVWRVGGKRQVIYARQALNGVARVKAAAEKSRPRQ